MRPTNWQVNAPVVEQVFPGMSAYTASKSAHSAYLQTLAKEWRRYKVSVNYFGSRKATLVRGAIVQVDLQSAFGTSRMKQQTLTLRLLEQSGQVMVGEFDVDASGRIVPVAH